MDCKRCKESCVRRGFQADGTQRYFCKACKLSQQKSYRNKAYKEYVNSTLVSYLKEGLGIRSIARLLGISVNTVMSRIKKISAQIRKPTISLNKEYQMDEMRTYIGQKKTFGLDCLRH